MDIFVKRDEIKARLAEVVASVKAGEDRGEKMAELTAELEALNAKCDEVAKADKFIADLGTSEVNAKTSEVKAKTIGEHFVKHALAAFRREKASRNMNIMLPEFKAGDDLSVHTTISSPTYLDSVQVDRNFVRPYEYPLTVSSWLPSGTMTERTLVYFIEKVSKFPVEGSGAVAVVAENAKKPQLHFDGYEQVTETLKKIAGYIKVSTEMIDDQEYLVTELNNRLLNAIRRFEEVQLLKGDGAGQNIKGLLNRDGILSETAKKGENVADAIYKCFGKIQNATGLDVDGIVINPEDYEVLRLSKDANGQYFAGGYFLGQYGVSGAVSFGNPPLWGRNTIVTPAIDKGTVLIGAAKSAATVYRKGGLTINTAFENEDDFVYNRATILAEERLALAVRVPQAFCKLDIKAAAVPAGPAA